MNRQKAMSVGFELAYGGVDPRTKREVDEESGVDTEDPSYVSGEEDDSYNDDGGTQSETTDGMD